MTSTAEFRAVQSALGAELKRLREDRGLTQTKLARMLNVVQSTVSECESRPTLNYIFRIAKAFNLRVEISFREKK